MSGKSPKPIGKLRKAFRLIGGTLIGINLIGPLLIADQTEPLLSSIGLNAANVKATTGAKVQIIAPDKKTSHLFALSTYSPDLLTTMQYLQEPNRILQGYAYKNPVFGYKSMFDRLSFGLTGQIFPCTVLVPSGLSMEDIKNNLQPPGLGKEINIPGTAQDYMKLLTLHELTHCNQLYPFEDHSIIEMEADRNAFDKYLEADGNPDVVRTVLHWRIMQAMDTSISLNTEDSYSMIAGLYSRYFHDSVRITPEESSLGFKQAGAALKNYALSQRLGSRWQYNADALSSLIDQALNDDGFQAPSAVRTVMQLYRDSYRFFTMKPYTQPHPANPTPGIS